MLMVKTRRVRFEAVRAIEVIEKVQFTIEIPEWAAGQYNEEFFGNLAAKACPELEWEVVEKNAPVKLSTCIIYTTDTQPDEVPAIENSSANKSMATQDGGNERRGIFRLWPHKSDEPNQTTGN